MSAPNETQDKERLKCIEEYFRSEYADMLSLASYLLNNNKALAEVAVQDTFVFALEHMDKLTASPNPVGWLYNVLKNIVRHIYRDQQRLLKRVVSIGEAPELRTSDYGRDLRLSMSSFNDSDTILLIQFYIQGYSVKELARKYDISVGACKMRIKRAKENMKEKYSDLLG